MSIVDINRLKDIVETEFSDIVEGTHSSGVNELRIILVDESFIDIWYSLKLEGKYSYHWERRTLDGTVYRHDNAPHIKWRDVKTFPGHFHDGSEERVIESYISIIPEEGLRQFLSFARSKLRAKDRK